jgi:hypothetical protein
MPSHDDAPTEAERNKICVVGAAHNEGRGLIRNKTPETRHGTGLERMPTLVNGLKHEPTLMNGLKRMWASCIAPRQARIRSRESYLPYSPLLNPAQPY